MLSDFFHLIPLPLKRFPTTNLQLPLQNIPRGGKKQIKNECLKIPILFTDDTFEKSWTEGKKRGAYDNPEAKKYRPR